MYAVIKTGGKQYRVEAGAVVKVEKLPEEVGGKVVFSEVLMMGEGAQVEIGTPTLSGKTVTGTVIDQARSRKVRIIKMRRRKHYDKQGNHRQHFTAVKIDSIA